MQRERIERGDVDGSVSGGGDAHDGVAGDERAVWFGAMDSVMPFERLAAGVFECRVVCVADGNRAVIAGRGVTRSIADNMQDFAAARERCGANAKRFQEPIN